MKINYMDKNNNILTEIDVNFEDKTVNIINHTDNIFDRAFGNIENPDIDDFNYFINSRSIPKTRYNFDEEMKRWGITDTSPLGIVKFFKGKTSDDDNWLDFIED